MDEMLTQRYLCAKVALPFSKAYFQVQPDRLYAVDISKSCKTSLICRLQGLHQNNVRKRWSTRVYVAGTEITHDREKPVWQSKILSAPGTSIAGVRAFPWKRVCGRFSQRVLSLCWITMKWLAIPVLALSAVSELLFTLSAGKEIFIPLGMLIGVMLAKIVGNASLDVLKELQDAKSVWPLVVMGMFFVLLKIPGPYYPSWAAALFPHVANAGLVQTAFLFRESQEILGDI